MVAPDAVAPHGVDVRGPEGYKQEILQIRSTISDYRTVVEDLSEVAPPRARLQAADGTWLVVHGAVLRGQGADQRAIVIEPVAPRELAAVIVRAYGLSRRERQVAELVLRGLATKQVALTLELSVHTVTGYLKSLFAKVGVQSRRELAARFLVDHHLPRMFSGAPIAVDGWFADEP